MTSTWHRVSDIRHPRHKRRVAQMANHRWPYSENAISVKEDQQMV